MNHLGNDHHRSPSFFYSLAFGLITSNMKSFFPRSQEFAFRHNKIGDESTMPTKVKSTVNPSTAGSDSLYHLVSFHGFREKTRRWFSLRRRRSSYTQLAAPSLSTSSSSIFSRNSSLTRPSTDMQSSKSLELETLIVEHPSRTLRVTLTPSVCAT